MQQLSCQVCGGEENLLRCSGCKSVHYCSPECQKSDWKLHSQKCKEIQNKNKRDKEREERKSKGIKSVDDYADFELIGQGNFSEILRVRDLDTQQLYALKRMSKRRLQQVNKEKDVYMEKHCLSKLLENEYVIRLNSTFQDEENLYMLLEYVPNGELWNQIHTYGCCALPIVNYYLTHITKALFSIHQFGIVHRDIKSENILLTNNNQLKFIDFGTAKDMNDLTIEGSGNGRKGKTPFKHFVGTPQFMAPECVRNRDSTYKSDVYSLGVLYYQIMYGKYPFNGGSEYLVFQAALETELQFPDGWIDCQQFRDLVIKMMEKDIEKRISLEEVMQDPYWNNQQVNWDQLENYDEVLNKLNELDQFSFQLGKQLRKIDQIDDVDLKKQEIQNILLEYEKKIGNEEQECRYQYVKRLGLEMINNLKEKEQFE